MKKVVGSRFIIVSGYLSYRTIQDFLAEFYHPNHNKGVPLDLYMFLSDLKFRAVNGFERSQCCFAVVMNEQVTRPCHNGGPRISKNLLIYVAFLASYLTDFQELVYQIFTSLNFSEQISDKQLFHAIHK